MASSNLTFIVGTNNDDNLYGDSNNNFIVGMTGNDTIQGGVGNASSLMRAMIGSMATTEIALAGSWMLRVNMSIQERSILRVMDLRLPPLTVSVSMTTSSSVGMAMMCCWGI